MWLLVAAAVLASSEPPSRSALALPDTVWSEVRARIHAEDRPIGYTETEMRAYGRDLFLLPTILRSFEDVRSLARDSGRITDELLEDSGADLAETARRAFLLLDVSAGRRTMPAQPESLLELPDHLPAPIRRLTGRLYAGAEAVSPWVRAAYDIDREATTAALYSTAVALRNDEQFDQLASLSRESLRLYRTTDLAYLGYATALWLRHLETAVQEYRESESESAMEVETFRLTTPLGEVLIGGTGDDRHDAPAFLVVETGGADTYGPGFAVPALPHSPIAVVVDLAGDDRYVETADTTTGEPRPRPSFGAGVFGVGTLLDLGGDDVYRTFEGGLGSGCFGSGLLVDFAGNDTYTSDGRWNQGAARAGIGILLDHAGDDLYSCAQQSQGLGATLGAGILIDRSGDDRYVARDDGNRSELYEGQSVAMSQGCGYGRRADLGDGHSLAGGFGILVDGEGDDDYHAQAWAQGCGYWWGVGILEDRSGDDRYRNGKYSSGAAAHFAIGLHVDLAGDDLYNEGNETAKNQYQGHARDGSIGLFLDGGGDDVYTFRTHCAGSGDLASIGLFWDRAGEDVYRFTPGFRDDSPWARTPPMGSTTAYEPMRSFRDDLPAYGIFLDTGGADRYETGGIGADRST